MKRITFEKNAFDDFTEWATADRPIHRRIVAARNAAAGAGVDPVRHLHLPAGRAESPMTDRSPITFQSLDAGDDGSFEGVYHLYAEAIDPRGQKPRDQLAALRSRPDYEILVARKDGLIVGFSVLFVPPGEPFSLLEYLAVEATERGGGVGGSLFRQSQEIVAARQGRWCAMLVEVDSDRIPSPDQELCEKRQRFYRRLGCLRIKGLPYELPLPMEGAPPEMDLLVHLTPERKVLAKSELEHWLQVVYREVYGCAPDDPRPRRMLERVADPVGLV